MREQKPKDEKKIGVNSFKIDAGPTTGKKKVHRSSTENGSSRIKPTSSRTRENIKLISQHRSALSKRISKKMVACSQHQKALQ